MGSLGYLILPLCDSLQLYQQLALRLVSLLKEKKTLPTKKTRKKTLEKNTFQNNNLQKTYFYKRHTLKGKHVQIPTHGTHRTKTTWNFCKPMWFRLELLLPGALEFKYETKRVLLDFPAASWFRVKRNKYGGKFIFNWSFLFFFWKSILLVCYWNIFTVYFCTFRSITSFIRCGNYSICLIHGQRSDHVNKLKKSRSHLNHGRSLQIRRNKRITCRRSGNFKMVVFLHCFTNVYQNDKYFLSWVLYSVGSIGPYTEAWICNIYPIFFKMSLGTPSFVRQW